MWWANIALVEKETTFVGILGATLQEKVCLDQLRFKSCYGWWKWVFCEVNELGFHECVMMILELMKWCWNDANISVILLFLMDWACLMNEVSWNFGWMCNPMMAEPLKENEDGFCCDLCCLNVVLGF